MQMPSTYGFGEPFKAATRYLTYSQYMLWATLSMVNRCKDQILFQQIFTPYGAVHVICFF